MCQCRFSSNLSLYAKTELVCVFFSNGPLWWIQLCHKLHSWKCSIMMFHINETSFPLFTSVNPPSEMMSCSKELLQHTNTNTHTNNRALHESVGVFVLLAWMKCLASCGKSFHSTESDKWKFKSTAGLSTKCEWVIYKADVWTSTGSDIQALSYFYHNFN